MSAFKGQKGPSPVASARKLSRAVNDLQFQAPVAAVYNPLQYAWRMHRAYLEKYAAGKKEVVFLGMNPGPWGMAQTGVPFGEVTAVRDWLGIEGEVGKPEPEHPKRPIEGFACTRSEVSGRRLWGLFQERFGSAEAFFADHFVANFCPLVFMEESGRNRTPDALPKAERAPLFGACEAHLRELIAILQPSWLIGVGGFAEKQAKMAIEDSSLSPHPQIGKILHPSPASPAANKDWAGMVTAQLKDLGVW